MNARGADADAPLAVAAWSLCRRELVRFVRQRSRLLSGLLTPLLMWLILGAGLNRSFQPPGMPDGAGYVAYFYPGSVLLVVLFTAIFSTISTIEDRNAGFLQAVLVAPVSRGAIVLGKVLGGTLLATGQAALFLLLAPLAGLHLGLGAFFGALGILFLVAFALTSLGFIFAWRMDSVAGFHGVMNLILMPMWLLSGAFFPISGAHNVLAVIVRCNPLSYGLAPLRHALGGGESAISIPAGVGVTILFAAAMFALASVTVRRSTVRP